MNKQIIVGKLLIWSLAVSIVDVNCQNSSATPLVPTPETPPTPDPYFAYQTIDKLMERFSKLISILGLIAFIVFLFFLIKWLYERMELKKSQRLSARLSSKLDSTRKSAILVKPNKKNAITKSINQKR